MKNFWIGFIGGLILVFIGACLVAPIVLVTVSGNLIWWLGYCITIPIICGIVGVIKGCGE